MGFTLVYIKDRSILPNAECSYDANNQSPCAISALVGPMFVSAILQNAVLIFKEKH